MLIKDQLRNWLKYGLYFSGISRAFHRVYGGDGMIFMFHRVCPPSNRPRISYLHGLEVTPEFLENVILHMKHAGYRFISLDELHMNLVHGLGRKDKFVAFTFDDGYLDNLVHGYPIFKRYNVPFTIYVTTGFTDRSAIMWWYLIEDIILSRDHVVLEVDNGTLEMDCSTPLLKEEAFQNISSHLTEGADSAKTKCLERMLQPFNADLYRTTDELALTWDQLHQLINEPLVTLGAHTEHHYCLNVLRDTEAMNEIKTSKDKLENHLDCSIDHFAYPFGSRAAVGPREFALAETCGFKTATTTRFANVFHAHRDHLMSLPRVDIRPSMLSDIRFLNLKANGLEQCLSNKFKRIITD